MRGRELVTRTDYSGDRRGVAVRLTDTGLKRLTAAQDTQRRILTEHLPPA